MAQVPHLLNMINLIVLPLLIPGDFPLRLLGQFVQVLVRVFLNGVLCRLGQRQPVLVHPFIQPPVNYRGYKDWLRHVKGDLGPLARRKMAS